MDEEEVVLKIITLQQNQSLLITEIYKELNNDFVPGAGV